MNNLNCTPLVTSKLPAKAQIKPTNVVVIVATAALSLLALHYLNSRTKCVDYIVSELENMFADLFGCCKRHPKHETTLPLTPPENQVHPVLKTEPTVVKFHTPVPPGMTKEQLKRYRLDPNSPGSPLRTPTQHYTPVAGENPPAGYKSPEQFAKEMEQSLKGAKPVEQAIAFAGVCSVPASTLELRDARLSSFSALEQSLQNKIKQETVGHHTPKKLLQSVAKATPTIFSYTGSPQRTRVQGPDTPANKVRKSLIGKLMFDIPDSRESGIDTGAAYAVQSEIQRDPTYDYDKCLAVTQLDFMHENQPLTVLAMVKKIIQHESMDDFCAEHPTRASHAWLEIPACFEDDLLKYLEDTYPKHNFEDAFDTDFLNDLPEKDWKKVLITALSHLEEVYVSDSDDESDLDTSCEDSPTGADPSYNYNTCMIFAGSEDIQDDEPSIALSMVKKIIENEPFTEPFVNSNAGKAWECIPISYDDKLLDYLRKTYPGETFDDDLATDTCFLNKVDVKDWKDHLLNILNHLEENAGNE